ncbi:sugar phosphate isomerase/epimerase [Streptomyces sp. Ncost-T10-10d]|uniref:sugar phosphate isomerase/epimerase family protein n=1 Tax=Streptomyces sp. Ncost-T10-10d TaxID=1839774 RepID=UPI00081D58F3|nr:sugar phosphate isomerase/epimerase [Streptomyces sp. Ncost-T10-10d]SCF75830.1 Sugar phosphate isomerase/epimerase [Streptomyces sp. Ncost-T10-10d]
MDRTRRTFLSTAVGVAAATGLGATSVSATEARRRRRIPPSGIGMHLYTMRNPLATDFRGTLERLAEIGYATVGVSGRHGHSAADIRRMLDETRLRAVLEHVAYDIVKGAGLPQALEDIHTLGGKWIVVPSLPGSLHSPAGYREVAREFNRVGLAARESGLKLLYHNHGTDHQVVDGVSLYDILLAETDPELVAFELDLYWAANGGASAPGELFVRHPRRFPALHVKDMAPNGDFADVGSGVLDFPAMFDTARRGGVKQWLVEHDAPADPFASALASYTYLSRLRY